MATALASGVSASGKMKPEQMLAIDPDPSARTQIAEKIPKIHAEADYRNIGMPETIILAVKPQHMHAASQELRAYLNTDKSLIISIAAGISLETLCSWLGAKTAIVRCMPNTPALLGCGATALSASNSCDKAHRQNAEQIMASVGMTVWCEESLMDAVTAVSGSGPAYFFLLAEALVEAGCALGMPKDIAQQLSAHTALGAARMICESGTDVAQLRRNVTSPGGTTECALNILEQGDMKNLWKKAIKAAATRSAVLSSENSTAP